MEALDAVGLSPKGACGDVVRNVTGCPWPALRTTRLSTPRSWRLKFRARCRATTISTTCRANLKFRLPDARSGARIRRSTTSGLTAIRRGKDVGYSVRVGGGLSNEPHLAARLNAFVKPEQAAVVVRAIAEIFRDQQGLRESRDRARLKYLFMKEGWTADRFLAEIEKRIGYKLDPAVDEAIPDDILRDHAGIHPQKQFGLSYVGASVLRGRLTGDQLAAAANWRSVLEAAICGSL